jgi:heme exporter protein D
VFLRPGDHGVPVWLVALVLALASPLLVRLYAQHLERQIARRTERFVERLARETRVAAAKQGEHVADEGGGDEVKGASHDG